MSETGTNSGTTAGGETTGGDTTNGGGVENGTNGAGAEGAPDGMKNDVENGVEKAGNLGRHIRVRPMQDGDGPAVVRLFDELGYPGCEAAEVERRQRLLAARGDVALLVAVEPDGTLVGFLQVMEKHTLNQAPQANVHSVVVDEGRRGQGLGNLLMDAAEDWARGRGLAALSLYTREHRERAHRFYEARGYRLEKRSHGYMKAL